MITVLLVALLVVLLVTRKARKRRSVTGSGSQAATVVRLTDSTSTALMPRRRNSLDGRP